MILFFFTITFIGFSNSLFFYYNGLVGFYKFENVGSTVSDSSGCNNDGFIYGNAEKVFLENPPACGTFHGIKLKHGYVGIPNSGSLNFDPSLGFAISLWVKHDELPYCEESMGNYFTSSTIVRKGLINQEYHLSIGSCYKDSGGGHGFSNGNCEGDGGIVLHRGIWYHVVVSKISTNHVNLYVNGVTMNGYGWSRSGCTSNSGDEIFIGVLNPGASEPGFFNGTIANFQIYNRGLSVSEINYLGQTCIECEECLQVSPSSGLCSQQDVYCVGVGQKYVNLQDAIDDVVYYGSQILLKGGVYDLNGVVIGSSSGTSFSYNEIKPMKNDTVVLRKITGSVDRKMTMVEMSRSYWWIHNGEGKLILEGSKDVQNLMGSFIKGTVSEIKIGPLYLLSHGGMNYGIESSQNMVIDGVVIVNEGKKDFGMYYMIGSSSGVTIKNCQFLGIEWRGININNSPNNVIENCYFESLDNEHRNTQYEPTKSIEVYWTCNNLLIKNNTFSSTEYSSYRHTHIWIKENVNYGISGVSIDGNLFSCVNSTSCFIFEYDGPSSKISSVSMVDSCFVAQNTSRRFLINTLNENDLLNDLSCENAFQNFNIVRNDICLLKYRNIDCLLLGTEDDSICNLESGLTTKCFYYYNASDDTSDDTFDTCDDDTFDTSDDDTFDTSDDDTFDTSDDDTFDTSDDDTFDTSDDDTFDTSDDDTFDTSDDDTFDTSDDDTFDTTSDDDTILCEEKTIVFSVEVCIGGNDTLYLRDNMVWFVHDSGSYEVPCGPINCQNNREILLNGVYYSLEWNGDYSQPITLPKESSFVVSEENPTVSLSIFAYRGPITIIQQPSRSNNYETQIFINDKSYGGSFVYRFVLIGCGYFDDTSVEDTLEDTVEDTLEDTIEDTVEDTSEDTVVYTSNDTVVSGMGVYILVFNLVLLIVVLVSVGIFVSFFVILEVKRKKEKRIKEISICLNEQIKDKIVGKENGKILEV